MLCRSYLFVPAEEGKIEKINSLCADAIIIDLEDSIKDAHKEDAIRCVCKTLETQKFNKEIFVRINTSNFESEIAKLGRYENVGLVIPKVENLQILDWIKDKGYKNKIIALLETPKGIVDIENIVSHERVYAVGFGAQDFCVSTGTLNHEKYLNPIKSKILLYARTYNKKALDMVEAEYKDEKKFTAYAQNSHDFGFDGKLCIHPNQTKIVNQIWEYDLDKLKELISAYENSDHGFVMYDGIVLEKPHIDKIKEICKLLEK